MQPITKNTESKNFFQLVYEFLFFVLGIEEVRFMSLFHNFLRNVKTYINDCECNK